MRIKAFRTQLFKLFSLFLETLAKIIILLSQLINEFQLGNLALLTLFLMPDAAEEVFMKYFDTLVLELNKALPYLLLDIRRMYGNHPSREMAQGYAGHFSLLAISPNCKAEPYS